MQIKRNDTILTVPCIGDDGNGPGRRVRELLCEVHGGKLVTPSRDPLTVTRLGHDLRGWGEFDGPAYDVTNGVWHVSVPADTIQQLVDQHGMVQP